MDPTSYGARRGLTRCWRSSSTRRPPRAPRWARGGRRRRGEPGPPPLDARTLARLAARYAGTGPGTVVGFGLSNDERRGSIADFAAAFDIARRAGLACVPHGGGCSAPTRSPRRSIGSGPTGSATGSAASRTWPCSTPSSSRASPSRCAREQCRPRCLRHRGRGAAAPARRAWRQVALGADDPLLFGSRLVDQYATARSVGALSDVELAHLARTSLRGSRPRRGRRGRGAGYRRLAGRPG